MSSQLKNINCGVPQGSVLDPLLFLLYITDLSNVCKCTIPLFFADDTNLFINGNNINEQESLINSELAEIAKWLKVNKLSFNINKTQCMIFTTKRKIIPGIVINIEGHIINEVDSTKFLGIYLDNKLNWKKHIAYVSGKVARGIGLIIKARKVLNSDALITLYYSFIFPYLSYCNHIWGATYATNLQKLVIQQKKIIRIIAGMKHREPTANAFRELRIIKFLDVNKMLIGCFMYKYHHQLFPDIFNYYFQCVRNVHNHNTRQNFGLYASHMKTDLGQTCIGYRGPVIHYVLTSLVPNRINHPKSYSFVNGLIWIWNTSSRNFLLVWLTAQPQVMWILWWMCIIKLWNLVWMIYCQFGLKP